jgi:hypothetical protein
MLVPLVNQFGLMQQQMFDQFQQAMAMMVQMFGTMHRDQMEVIRAELDRLNELTEEFHALKSELANRSASTTPPGESVLGSVKEPDRMMAVDPGVSAATPGPITSGPLNGLGAAPPIQRPPLAFGTSEQQPFPEPRPRPTRPLSSQPAAPLTSEPLQEPGLDSSTKPDRAGAAANSDRDTVVWLHQRIMTLQRERESRWQKILKLLPGMS